MSFPAPASRVRLATLFFIVGVAPTLLLLAFHASAKEYAASLEISEWDRKGLARLQSSPLGLPPIPIPDDNPPTLEKIALGRKLFFDRRLSFNNTMSCAMCHIPEQGFTNNELATPVGVEGRSVRRNSPTIVNSAFIRHVFHDGRETSLENQVLSPLLAKNEMANPSIGYVIAKIEQLPDYQGLFEQAFGAGPSVERLGQAIASWERTMIGGNTPFDRWYYQDQEDALTSDQKAGFDLFAGKGRCISCHTIGPDYALFTDNQFHDTGVGFLRQFNREHGADSVLVEIAPGTKVPVPREYVQSVGEKPQEDLGRFEITLNPRDKWRYKTPSLRNVSLTAPYMHDGSLKSLEDVIRFYNWAGVPHPGLDPLVQQLTLSQDEMDQLIAFLESLTTPEVSTLRDDARSVAIGN